jgi:hypothetical protein
MKVDGFKLTRENLNYSAEGYDAPLGKAGLRLLKKQRHLSATQKHLLKAYILAVWEIIRKKRPAFI